jgi:hypothetical protein
MPHKITDGLERLAEKLSEDSRVDFFVMSRHKVIDGGIVHGFGVIILTNKSGEMRPIAGASDSADSTHMRGAYAATLSALEWASFNCHSKTAKCVHTALDPIYHHLPRQINKWITQPDRSNVDLIRKIHSVLTKVGEVGFEHLATRDKRYRAAHSLANDAADLRGASEKSVSCVTNAEFADIEFVDDAEWLFRRALNRNV